MSFTKQATADKIYYDITVSNLSSVETTPPTLYFNETRNNPFILDPETYYLSIVRFTLDTTTLPVIQPQIQPNQSNRDLTLYSFTLSWTNPVAPFQEFNFQQFVIFEPQNLSTIIPAPPSQTNTGLQNTSTGYYDIYSTQYWIYLINKTLISAYNGLNALVVGAGLVLPSANIPVMTWSNESNIAILNADIAGYDDTQANYISIWMNSNMYQLFSSFPVIIQGLSTAGLGKNVRIATNSLGGSNQVQFPPVAPTYTALQIVQEYSTLAVWTPITSIVFTSNTLPIVPNQVSAPLLFFNGNRFSSGGNNSNISQVITDFVGGDGIYKPSITYLPTAQYRLVSLMGNTPIYNLDVEVFYKNRVGELVPFRLSSGSTATIKILFTRKGTEGDGIGNL
jgi:hypothetical protein